MNTPLLSSRLLAGVPDGDFLQELLRPVPSNTLVTGRWCPLHLEPLIGSGERLCVGVAVVVGDEQLVVRAPGLDRLSCFYGKEGADFLLELIDQAVESLSSRLKDEVARQYLLDERNPLTFWQPPVEGLRCGKVLMGRGRDLEQIARMGLTMSSSLFRELPVEQQQKLRLTRTRLEDSVSNIWKRSNVNFDAYFRRPQSLFAQARPATYSFLGDNLAANFDVLDPEELGPTVNSIKIRIADLETLQTQLAEQKIVDTGLFANPNREYRLFLHLLPIIGNERQQEKRQQSVAEAFAEIEGMAKQWHLPILWPSSASEIAADVVALEQS